MSISVTGDLVTEIFRFKSQDGPLLQVHGSWQLIQSLLAHGLVDEFRHWTFLVVVGSGKPPFGPRHNIHQAETHQNRPMRQWRRHEFLPAPITAEAKAASWDIRSRNENLLLTNCCQEAFVSIIVQGFDSAVIMSRAVSFSTSVTRQLRPSKER